MGQRTQMSTSPVLEELRTQLLVRGVDPAMADQLTFNRSSAQSAAPAMQHASGPQLNQVRVELQGGGMDPRQVNRDFVQVANSRAFSKRFENRTQANERLQIMSSCDLAFLEPVLIRADERPARSLFGNRGRFGIRRAIWLPANATSLGARGKMSPALCGMIRH